METKITTQELQELQDLNRQYVNTMASIGECEVMMEDLNEQLNKLKSDKSQFLNDYTKIKEKTEALTKELTAKAHS